MLPAFLMENEFLFHLFLSSLYVLSECNHAPHTTSPRICAAEYVHFIPFIRFAIRYCFSYFVISVLSFFLSSFDRWIRFKLFINVIKFTHCVRLCIGLTLVTTQRLFAFLLLFYFVGSGFFLTLYFTRNVVNVIFWRFVIVCILSSSNYFHFNHDQSFFFFAETQNDSLHDTLSTKKS